MLGMLSIQMKPALNWQRSGNWSDWVTSPRTTSFHRQKPQMDSTPDASNQFEVIASVKQEIELLKTDLMQLVETTQESDLMPRARARVSDHGLSDCVRDADLRRWLGDCLLKLKPKSKGKRKGQKLDLAPVPWALDSILMKHRLNMLIAEPKVGKTSLILSMISAWHHGEPTFLGKELIGPCPPVIIVGTDQPEVDWGTMLHAEGLMTSDCQMQDPLVAFWSAADPLHFDEDGFKLLEEVCEEFPEALVLCDSYHACVANLNCEDGSSTYANPLAQLLTVTAPHRATTVVIHHANKGQGGSIVSKARGTTALTAIPSQNILLSPMAGENNPNDRRIQLKTQGRAGRPENLIIERTDDGWISHGDGEALVQEQRRADTVLNLPDKDAEVYAYILERTEQGFPVAQNELVANRDLRLKQYQASRLCARLVRQGLIEQSGRTDPSLKGGRPSPLFKAIGTLSQELHSTLELHETSRAHEIKGFNAVNSDNALLQQRGFNAPPLPAFNCPVEVQLVPGGDWTPDHITCGPAPGDQLFIRLADGNPDVRRPLPRSRIRHPNPEPTTAETPSAVSPPSGAATHASQPLTGASDEPSAPDQFPYGF